MAKMVQIPMSLFINLCVYHGVSTDAIHTDSLAAEIHDSLADKYKSIITRADYAAKFKK